MLPVPARNRKPGRMPHSRVTILYEGVYIPIPVLEGVPAMEQFVSRTSQSGPNTGSFYRRIRAGYPGCRDQCAPLQNKAI